MLILIFPAPEKSKGKIKTKTKTKTKDNVKGSGQECPLYTIAPRASPRDPLDLSHHRSHFPVQTGLLVVGTATFKG